MGRDETFSVGKLFDACRLLRFRAEIHTASTASPAEISDSRAWIAHAS